MQTLGHLRGKAEFRAGSGGKGQGQKKRGTVGQDMAIVVPLGTIVWKQEGDGPQTLVAEMLKEERVLVVEGGAGGRGNARYTTPVNREPLLAAAGEEGEEAELLLELRMLADVGIIGKPNVGKSALLAACSAARPRIAEYPFTTVEPTLGVAEVGYRSLILVELPGLVEGAHQGVGLGNQFLRHALRARLLLHLLDGSSPDPRAELEETRRELGLYSPALVEKPYILVVNKVDLPEVRERVPELKKVLTAPGVPLHFISAATAEGVTVLLERTLELLAGLPQERPSAIARLSRGPRRRREGLPRVEVHDEVYVVYSSQAERLAALADLSRDRVKEQFVGELRRLGIVRRLVERGVQPGDTVRIGTAEMEW